MHQVARFYPVCQIVWRVRWRYWLSEGINGYLFWIFHDYEKLQNPHIGPSPLIETAIAGSTIPAASVLEPLETQEVPTLFAPAVG